MIKCKTTLSSNVRRRIQLKGIGLLVTFIAGFSGAAQVLAKEPDPGGDAVAVLFKQSEGSLQIAIGGQPIADYVYRDDQVLRPYFRNLRTLSGVQVTRNHPPVKGQDIDDHPTMHPGLWLAFGDLNGVDFWRNKGQVRHLRFNEKPQGKAGHASFSVENVYEAEGRTFCTEICKIAISVQPAGYVLDWRSTFQSKHDFAFGDQEEMGLGLRVATHLAVSRGGEIFDSESRKNEAGIWGKQAEWCQYSGVIDRQRVGVVVMPAPENFRRSWFHARDYGLLVANPFGQNAFTKGDQSKIKVNPAGDLHLRFGIVVYETPADQPADIADLYQKYLKQ